MTCSRCPRPAQYDVTKRNSYYGETLREITHGERYCYDCAEKRQRELRRSDERRMKREQVRRYGVNTNSNDCALVAIAKTTGVPYEKVVTIFKRHGYKPGKQALQAYLLPGVFQEVADLKGLKVEHIDREDCGIGFLDQATPMSYAKTASRSDRFILIAQMGNSGHAMSVTDAVLNNANAGWANRSQCYMALRVVKA